MTPRPLDDDPAVQEIAEVVRSAEERLRDLAYDRLREAVEQGAEQYLWVLGLISLSLALLNLLPLLPLDGGHILFSLLEGVRRKAVAREVYERASAVGLALVLILFFIGLSNDIGRLSE